MFCRCKAKSLLLPDKVKDNNNVYLQTYKDKKYIKSDDLVITKVSKYYVPKR